MSEWEWIPFRYASAADAVLLKDEGSKLVLNKAEDIRKAYFDIGEHDWIDADGEIVEEVTHWMPLPEPPK